MDVKDMSADEIFEFVKTQTRAICGESMQRETRLAFECGMLRGIIAQLIILRDKK